MTCRWPWLDGRWGRIKDVWDGGVLAVVWKLFSVVGCPSWCRAALQSRWLSTSLVVGTPIKYN